uniref:NADH-ubiquinone oxidoreductase chain 1 n=1 Tax=Ophiacantha linea TaxID=1357420 RepID=V9NK62_9ECHI|nr:NADH dehydrogenase subunit 1 [Ophiacantha linea]AGQ49789.1 NADH dehydrogenase subunit 1 [Ophiacantha linea]
MDNFIVELVVNQINLLIVIVPVLLSVALLTLLERKVLGYIQFRKGPNLVGPLGLLQPIADGLKLFIKENFKPSSASNFLFYISPLIFFFINVFLWGVAPFSESGINLNLSFLFILAISSLSVYALLAAGWASNSKYSLLGSVRGVAQMISYEVSLSLVILPVILLIGGWGLSSVVNLNLYNIWLFIPCFPLFLMWYISCLAETNRSPFDLAEGESELVSGYNVEYSGAPFALFFIGEYANIIFINLISVVLFLGGGSPLSNIVLFNLLLVFKLIILVVSFLWVRASFPRIRYDQLMMLMWKGILPFTLGLLIFYCFLILLLINVPFY